MTSTLSSKAKAPGSSDSISDTQTHDPKHRALKQLNAKYQPLRSAVNLIQANADRASRQIDEEYNRERRAILSGRDHGDCVADDDWELRA